MNYNKTSILIPSQLPEFVRDNPDYEKFVLFVKAYYEWMETNGQTLYYSKNLLDNVDIDKTLDEFLKYYINDFLPYFPEEALIDKRQAIKIAKQLYKSKGTPASFEFLFKILYNSDFEIFYTKDLVLKASDGEWYITKSLKLDTNDRNFLSIKNYRIIGETTKSFATVENAIIVGNKIEIFIADIERLFQSGEFIRVIDNQNQDILFNGQPLRGKILGQISQININPKNRGTLYQKGDPVIVYGGLNSNTGVGATAEVNETTKGSIRSISVVTGGYGFRESPDSIIILTDAPGANAVIGSVDDNPSKIAEVTFLPTDLIFPQVEYRLSANNYHFSNIAITDANTTLLNAFSFTSFTTYPISSILVTNGGGGISAVPGVFANSLYNTNLSEIKGNIVNIGILAPIQILNGGVGYEANDTILISGGTGVGAYAKVTSVNSNGSITSVSFVPGQNSYPLGGLGYKSSPLPTVSVVSSNVQASNASLYIPGILGFGDTYSLTTDRIGSITSIKIINPGEDYVATPNVSFKVHDVVVKNVLLSDLPIKGDIVYQGENFENSTYRGYFNSLEKLQYDVNPLLSLYAMRVYEFNAKPNPNLPLKIVGKNIEWLIDGQFNSSYDINGIRSFGDGTARATASFLNGLVYSQGQYLNSKGQLSSYDILQNENYNDYTYEITVQKEIAKYRDILLNLLHPSGTKILGRYKLASNSTINMSSDNILTEGHTLAYYTGDDGSTATMRATWDNASNNIITFTNLVGTDLREITFANNFISIKDDSGLEVYSEIISVDADSLIIKDNVWLTFANVAYVTADTGQATINIKALTGAYDIINNGNYSNTAYPLKDIVRVGDKVLVANNTERTVASVNYLTGTITLSSNLSANVGNSLMSVNRTITSSSGEDVKFFGRKGVSFFSQLVTELGDNITTQDGTSITIG